MQKKKGFQNMLWMVERDNHDTLKRELVYLRWHKENGIEAQPLLNHDFVFFGVDEITPLGYRPTIQPLMAHFIETPSGFRNLTLLCLVELPGGRVGITSSVFIKNRALMYQGLAPNWMKTDEGWVATEFGQDGWFGLRHGKDFVIHAEAKANKPSLTISECLEKGLLTQEEVKREFDSFDYRVRRSIEKSGTENLFFDLRGDLGSCKHFVEVKQNQKKIEAEKEKRRNS